MTSDTSPRSGLITMKDNQRGNYPLTVQARIQSGGDVNAASQLPAGFEYADLRELLALISRLTGFLHPGTSHSEPGDEDALKWAQRILNRYRPAS